jgi:hypothetical protein
MKKYEKTDFIASLKFTEDCDIDPDLLVRGCGSEDLDLYQNVKDPEHC